MAHLHIAHVVEHLHIARIVAHLHIACFVGHLHIAHVVAHLRLIQFEGETSILQQIQKLACAQIKIQYPRVEKETKHEN